MTIDTGGRYVHQKTVDRVTPTTVVVDGTNYRRTGNEWNIGKKIKKAASGRSDRWNIPWMIRHPDEAAERLREQALATTMRECTNTIHGPLTLDTIPAMRAALDRAEAALREGDQ